MQIKAPLFIGYGTADNTSDYCDLLPLDFIRLDKHNYTLKPYAGYDHNFNNNWDQVADDTFTWLKK